MGFVHSNSKETTHWGSNSLAMVALIRVIN